MLVSPSRSTWRLSYVFTGVDMWFLCVLTNKKRILGRINAILIGDDPRSKKLQVYKWSSEMWADQSVRVKHTPQLILGCSPMALQVVECANGSCLSELCAPLVYLWAVCSTMSLFRTYHAACLTTTFCELDAPQCNWCIYLALHGQLRVTQYSVVELKKSLMSPAR